LNLKNPKNLNEKIQWLKLFWKNELVVKCADKYEMRQYVIDNECEEILLDLYGVYNTVDEIDFGKLPKKLALKATHGCGYNIICDDKENLDIEKVRKQLRKWLKNDFSKENAEIHYSKIKPRIICEKFIESESGGFLYDYKIFCFNGKAELVLICTDRENGLKRYIVDMDWKPLKHLEKNFPVKEFPKRPECFDRIVYYAEKLSKPFPFVRMDFYEYEGKPILGEMTFTPVAGMITYFDENELEKLGNIIELPVGQ